jgi:dipeptidyl-peptidase-4
MDRSMNSTKAFLSHCIQVVGVRPDRNRRKSIYLKSRHRLSLLVFFVYTSLLIPTEQGFAQLDGAAYTNNKHRNAAKVHDVAWAKDEKRLFFKHGGKSYSASLDSLKILERTGDDENVAKGLQVGDSLPLPGGSNQGRPGFAKSPSGNLTATSEGGNVFIVDNKTGRRIRITGDGAPKLSNGLPILELEGDLPFVPRIGLWWTSDEKFLLFAKFDSSRANQIQLVEGFAQRNPKTIVVDREIPGTRTYVVNFFLYHVTSGNTTQLRLGAGEAGYAFNIRYAPDGSLLCSWSNLEHTVRKELLILAAESRTKTIVEEKHDKPLARDYWSGEAMRFLKDSKRFLWLSSNSGFRHYELRSMDGERLHQITQGQWDVEHIVFVDEETGRVGYTAFSSETSPYSRQFHVANLDGSKSWRVTCGELYYSEFQISPNRQWLIATSEAPNIAPSSTLFSMDGTEKVRLAKIVAKETSQHAETFKFRSSDGRFDIHGILFLPADYDPKRRYPLLAMPYGLRGGPTWWPVYVGSPLAIDTGSEFIHNRKYIIMQVNNRGTMFRGRDFVDAAHGKPLTVGAQDYAEAIRSLKRRTDIDFERVGIVGSSFGGGLACLAVLRHPDVFCAGASKSGLMDWQNQSLVATSRFGMGTLKDNPMGYVSDSPLSHAAKLKRPFLLMHGLLDKRVYPNSAFMMSDAWDTAGASYEMKLYPNAGHGLGNLALRVQWEFLERHLSADR